MRLLICRFSLFVLILISAELVAQSQSPFTVDDLLEVKNVALADVSDDGRWVAATVSGLRDRIGIDNYRFGDPTYIAPSRAEVLVIDTQTAKAQKLFPDKRQVRAMKWSPDGSRLAILVLNEDSFKAMIWERANNKWQTVALPAAKVVAENTELSWTPDSAQLYLTVRSDEWTKQARAKFEANTKAPVVVLSSKEPFRAWDELRRMASVRSLVAVDVKSGQTREVIAQTKLSAFDLAEDGSFVTYNEDITKKTDYDVIFGSENQVQFKPTNGGETRTILKSTKGISLVWSLDGRRYAYAKDGNLFVGSVDDKEAKQIIGKKEEETGGKGEAEKGEVKPDAKEKYAVVRLNAKGDALIASNKEGLWLVDTATGAKENFLKMNEEDKEAPRYQVLEFHGDDIYLSYAARTKWERGLVRYNRATKQMSDLVKDARMYANFRLSKDGKTFVFSAANSNSPTDLFVADAEFKSIRRLTEANPQLASKRLSKTELISYLDVDGTRSYGVLYYPTDYEAGKKYPTVFNIYEQFFDDMFQGTINVLTNNGYAVVQPSVNLEQGFPGEAWVKGVTAAANKMIEMGVADPERLGVQGTSYGGYATNLLITQTNRFKAAINISGKVNMISFYTDSPRLGVRNIHAPEKSQDRIGATLWQQPQKYIAHSAIMHADRIKTPLLLMTGEQDHNVPARQAMEMYYALRRLGKEVMWVSYTNGGHGMPTATIDEVKDYHARIVQWYDDHLKGDLKKKAEAAKVQSEQK
ncbi:MAG TPA: prolyl oligopeptidase family serine peptidase [Blastocatellia bacterium]|nr:prolyl oligopeptidase family serine peptidase [Blastocatellia bacterium]